MYTHFFLGTPCGCRCPWGQRECWVLINWVKGGFKPSSVGTKKQARTLFKSSVCSRQLPPFFTSLFPYVLSVQWDIRHWLLWKVFQYSQTPCCVPVFFLFELVSKWCVIFEILSYCISCFPLYKQTHLSFTDHWIMFTCVFFHITFIAHVPRSSDIRSSSYSNWQ